MKSTDDRKLFGTLIGANAASSDIETIPATQTTAGNGRASIALAFPPETFIARSAGGNPPYGSDMNGFLNLLSSAIQVLQSGFLGPFDAAFAQSIGGYPAGAIVSGSAAGTFWVSTADANASTPGATGATWQSLFNGYATEAWANATFQPAGDYATNSALQAETQRATTAENGLQSSKANLNGGNSYTGTQWVNNSPIILHNSPNLSPGDWNYSPTLITRTDSRAGAHFFAQDQVNNGNSSVVLAYEWDGVVQIHWWFNSDGSITNTIKGQVAFQSDLPLPVGMHVQLFYVTIPQGTNMGNGTDPFVANLPRGFSNFVAVFGNDIGNSIYTVACAARNGAQVNLWVQSPQHTGGGLSGPVVVQLAAYGYY